MSLPYLYINWLVPSSMSSISAVIAAQQVWQCQSIYTSIHIWFWYNHNIKIPNWYKPIVFVALGCCRKNVVTAKTIASYNHTSPYITTFFRHITAFFFLQVPLCYKNSGTCRQTICWELSSYLSNLFLHLLKQILIGPCGSLVEINLTNI